MAGSSFTFSCHWSDSSAITSKRFLAMKRMAPGDRVCCSWSSTSWPISSATVSAYSPRRETSVSKSGTIGLVEDFDHVHHALAFAVESRAGLELQHAAGVGRGDDLRACAVHGIHLARQDLHGHFILHHVINAGAAAAEVRKRHLPKH